MDLMDPFHPPCQLVGFEGYDDTPVPVRNVIVPSTIVCEVRMSIQVARQLK